MKTLPIFLFATFLAASPLFAKDLFYRAKPKTEKSRFEIDPTVVSLNTPSETVFNEINPEKTLQSRPAINQTIRADKIGSEPILKQAPAPKKRKGHFREWP